VPALRSHLVAGELSVKRPRRLASLGPRLAAAELRSMPAPAKRADEHYTTPEHRAWRAAVIARAGGRCEWREGGVRCGRAEGRMFADHIVELADGGAPLDLGNGQCLCGSHHTFKTNAAKLARLAAAGERPGAGGEGV
jgi:hypothetical protein